MFLIYTNVFSINQILLNSIFHNVYPSCLNDLFTQETVGKLYFCYFEVEAKAQS